MTVKRMDHVGVIVNDLAAAKAFFLDLGLDVQGEAEVEGEWVDRVIGLDNAKSMIVMMRAPGSETSIELVQFLQPRAEGDAQYLPAANTLGIRHIALVVDDIDAVVARLGEKGVRPFGAVQEYEGIYKVCYIRGPEGIILELAEQLS